MKAVPSGAAFMLLAAPGPHRSGYRLKLYSGGGARRGESTQILPAAVRELARSEGGVETTVPVTYRGSLCGFEGRGQLTEGLRERKMRLTRRKMEQAAVDLAYEDGIQSVTVERICEIAMVSRSTFFNYFTSLAQAIFGAPLEYDPDLTERLLSEHRDELVVAAALIVTESVRGQADDSITQRRLALFAREPGTTTAVSWASEVSRGRLVAVIAEWLKNHRESAKLPRTEIDAEARLIVALSISVGDEAIRELQEVDGRLVIDPRSYVRARRRLEAILAGTD